MRTSAPISESKPHPAFAAKRKSGMEGISDELIAIASQKLDYAPARRRVRSAFVEVQQGLDHCSFKDAPPGIRTEKWYEKNSKGFDIFCKQWLPATGVPIKAALYFCHEYGGTCTFFFEGVARYIAASGYAVYATDYPGLGLSDGLHGYIRSFDEIVDDVVEQYTKIKEKPEVRALPQFMLGQSMGGAVALKVHLKEPQNWDGIILEAPMCKKTFNLTSKCMPAAKLFSQKDVDELFIRDPRKRKVAAYNLISYNDQMCLKTATELLKATNDIEKQLEKVFHGAADKVTDPMVIEFLYEKASTSDKTFKLYEQSYHFIFEGEPDDRIFATLDAMIEWLECRCF